MKRFFKSHECSELCHKLQLRRVDSNRLAFGAPLDSGWTQEERTCVMLSEWHDKSKNGREMRRRQQGNNKARFSAQKKKCKKKTKDQLLESKPRDKFESLEMHLFFF